MNTTDIQRLRKAASSPFWWTRFWTFRRAALSLCCELEKARKALEWEPPPRDLLMEIERLKAEKLKANTGIAKLIEFIHVHNRVGFVKPVQEMKRFIAIIVAVVFPILGALAAPAPLLRNAFTTNSNPQVNRGFGVTIQTNAGHKLVINVDTAALTNQLYWTNIAGLLRTIGDGRYTNLWIDTNIAAMTIGSIASIDPTNGNAFYGAGAGSNNVLTITGSVGIGSDALGNNSGAVADALAFGEAAFRDNSGTISISSAIGQGAGVVNGGSIENSTLIGSQAGGFNTVVKRGVVAIGHQALSTMTSTAITNFAMLGTVTGDPTTGVNLGSFGFANNFLNIAAASNRWIIGWSATNRLANSMVFGQAITNYQFGPLAINVNASNPSLIGLSSVINSTAITNQSPYAWTNFTPVASGINDNRRSLLTFDVIWGDPAASQITVCVTNGASIRTNTWGWDGVSVQVTNTVMVRIGPTNGFGFQTNGPASTANATMEPE